MGYFKDAYDKVAKVVKRYPAATGALAVGTIVATGGAALPIVIGAAAAGGALSSTIARDAKVADDEDKQKESETDGK